MATETQIVLLRGINVGGNNRIAMAALRDALTEAGYGNVRTYVQSGNVLLDTELEPETLRAAFEQLLAERFELKVPVVTRTVAEIAQVVARNPLAEAAADPKRYQVSFLSAPLDPAIVAELQSLATPEERLESIGRELYAWHPEGVARSKLWGGLAGRGGLGGVTATARNWTTVTTLLDMAHGT